MTREVDGHSDSCT